MSGRGRAREERSAGGVVVRRVDGEMHVLLIRDPYQNWGLPKGHVERGEGDLDAALREVREETGLEDLTVGPVVGTIDWYFRQGRRLVHKTCAFYLMRSSTGVPVPELDEGITECLWLPLDEAVAQVTYDNARDMVMAAAELLRSGTVEAE
ncbi:MAG: NUDIX hydrolase [Gemmatimonadetes bacterium]|nr:NUDIX hydrolase [Gemmatimonadota bacterium]